MTQPMDFDRFIADWLRTDGPADIRSEVVDRAIGAAARTGQRRGLLLALVGPAPWPAYGRRISFGTLPPVVRVAIAVALTLALVGGAAFVGSRLLRAIVPPPASSHGFVITRGSAPCPAPGGATTNLDGVTEIDPDSGVVRQLVECQTSLLLSPDGVHAAAGGADGLVLIDLRDGSRRTLAPSGGSDRWPTPIAWSPKGTYLVWSCGCDSSGAEANPNYLGPLDDPQRTRLPDGYGVGRWSADESRIVSAGEDAIGNGDGSDVRELAPAYQDLRFLAISSDGTRLAIRHERLNAARDTLAVDVAVGDGFAAPQPVTHFPDGTGAIAAAWSPDGSTLAVVSASRAEAATPGAPTTNDLWLMASDGRQRHIGLPLAIDPSVEGFGGSVTWSPDGRNVVIGWQTTVRDSQSGTPVVTRFYSFLIVAVADGTFRPTAAQRPAELKSGDGWTVGYASEVFFSPDGLHAVYHAYGGLEVIDLDGSGVRHLSLTDVAPSGGWGNQLVWLASR